jgi:hypothetical protein
VDKVGAEMNTLYVENGLIGADFATESIIIRLPTSNTNSTNIAYFGANVFHSDNNDKFRIDTVRIDITYRGGATECLSFSPVSRANAFIGFRAPIDCEFI